jgi:enoyl-[acyl-carrier-protein] reductase (NADH)
MAQNPGLMQGKRGIVLGVANNRSIALGNREGLPCGRCGE